MCVGRGSILISLGSEFHRCGTTAETTESPAEMSFSFLVNRLGFFVEQSHQAKSLSWRDRSSLSLSLSAGASTVQCFEKSQHNHV